MCDTVIEKCTQGTTTMARKAYGTLLTRRRNSYAVRVAVPLRLVKAGSYVTRTGKPVTSVVKVLAATALADAKVEARKVELDIRDRFDRMMAGLPVDDGTIRQIADQAGQEAYDMLEARLKVEKDRLPEIANLLEF